MCVIIVKGKNEKLPMKKSLRNCFNENPDGAGFMYTDSDKNVVIDKGYMDFKSFYSHYKKLCKKYNNFRGKNLIMHMRISTAGGVKPENTHPFPLTDNLKEMKKTNNKCEIGVVHNGIISATNPTKEQEKFGVNDTMLFIQQYLYPIHKDWKNCFKSTEYLAGISVISGSKFAILDKNDNLYMVGNFVQYNGNSYSNYSYEDYNYKYFKTYKYDLYDDYYTEEYYESKENENKEIEESFNEDIIFCEDNDKVSINAGDNYVKISELRTEENSMFIYDTSNLILEELSEDAEEILSIYYDCVMILDYQI